MHDMQETRNKMELTQLKYFQAMAKCRHFTQAAEEMAVSQSALSRSIQKLEQELGVTLFELHARTSALTEAGQKFLFHVDRVIRELALAEQEIELDNGGVGVVHLSFLHSLGDTFLPLILRQFHERYPHIDVKLNQQSSSMLAEQLTSGETDICLCSTMNEPDTAWMYLWSEEMFLGVPEDHPLAQKSRVSLREVGDEPFVALKPEYTLRQQVNQFLDLAESHPQIVFEGDEVHTLVSFVAAHLGVSVLPHVPCTEHLGVVFVPIFFPLCKRAVGIAWNTSRPLSPAAMTFQQFTIHHFVHEGEIPLTQPDGRGNAAR